MQPSDEVAADRAGSAIALLSGGLDSGTALALFCERGGTIAGCLFVDYGQRAVDAEARASRRLAERLGHVWRRVELPSLAAAAARSGCALSGGSDRALPEPRAGGPAGDDASAAAVWVPARNVVLVAIAAAEAEAAGADAVLVGFNREEAATFADNSAAFVAAFDALLALGTRSAVRVESPTLRLDKAQIVAQARRLGLGREDFWSCYAAASAVGEPCGRCESCVRSSLAWGGSAGSSA